MFSLVQFCFASKKKSFLCESQFVTVVMEMEPIIESIFLQNRHLHCRTVQMANGFALQRTNLQPSSLFPQNDVGLNKEKRGRGSKTHPWEVRTALWVAYPWAGVEACQGAEALVLDLIPVEQGAAAPCQVEQEAWASEGFLRTIQPEKNW